MTPARFRRWTIALCLPALLSLSGCATLQGVFALRQVAFSLDRVADVQLAGIDLARIQRYEDLGPADIARVVQAVSARQMPLSLVLHVLAENPEGNPEAQLLALDWTFLLEDRETVSGGLPAAVRIPVAGSANVPLEIRMDLLEFFEGNARDLVNLALSLVEPGAAPSHVSLRATPTVDTPIGPIRYPQPITIVSRDVGG